MPMHTPALIDFAGCVRIRGFVEKARTQRNIARKAARPLYKRNAHSNLTHRNRDEREKENESRARCAFAAAHISRNSSSSSSGQAAASTVEQCVSVTRPPPAAAVAVSTAKSQVIPIAGRVGKSRVRRCDRREAVVPLFSVRHQHRGLAWPM